MDGGAKKDIDAKGLNENILLDINKWRRMIHVFISSTILVLVLPSILGIKRLVVVVIVVSLKCRLTNWIVSLNALAGFLF